MILAPTYLSNQDSDNELAYALVGSQALLPAAPFAPPDPPNDPTLGQGATTTYGLGPVAIVPFTAIPTDSVLMNQNIQGSMSPFYLHRIALDPGGRRPTGDDHCRHLADRFDHL